MQARTEFGLAQMVGAVATVVMRVPTMFNIKSLIAATLLSSVAAVSFAQAPATTAPKAASTATAAAPADMASKPAAKSKKHSSTKHKKAAKPAASAASAAK